MNLTTTQKQTLRLRAIGYSNKEIAAMMNTSTTAVESRFRMIANKFPGLNPLHFVVLAIREEAVSLGELLELVPKRCFQREQRLKGKI